MRQGVRPGRAAARTLLLAVLPATLAGCLAAGPDSGPALSLRALFEPRPSQVAQLAGPADPASSPPAWTVPGPGEAVAQASPDPPAPDPPAPDPPTSEPPGDHPGPRVSRMVAVEDAELHAGPGPGAAAAGAVRRGETLFALGGGDGLPDAQDRLPVLRDGRIAWVARDAVESAYARRVDAFGTPRHAGGDRFHVAGVEIALEGVSTDGPLAEARIDAHVEARGRAVACRVFEGVGRCEFADGADLGFELVRAGLVRPTGHEYPELARFALPAGR